jgi:endoglycosylceramidase
MSRRCLVAWLCLALVALASARADARPPQLRRDGRWLVDRAGRVVVLHGVNAVWKLKPYVPPDEPRGFTEADAQWLEDHGFNAVRLGVLFAGVMPQRGVVDAGYLDEIDRVVQLLAAHHVYVLLDFHQDLYNEKFQGEGFPDWSVYDDGIPHLFNFGFPGNYFTPEVMRAFDNLWGNKKAPGDGIGLWDHYAAAWQAVAARWKDQPYLMGYDLLNEPWPGTDWPTCANPFGCPVHDTLKLQPFQQHALAGIRAMDPNNVVWFEPNSIFNSGAMSGLGLLAPVEDANLGLSWHNYCLPAGLVHSSGVNDVPGCALLHQIPCQYRAAGELRETLRRPQGRCRSLRAGCLR